MAGMTPDEGGMFSSSISQKDFKKALNKVYAWYTGGFIAFVIVLAIAEQMGLSRAMIGYVFLAATVMLYAGIGIMSRTNDAAEYYVAGRRVPAIYNGMATGADWMSAASFIGMAGTLYLTGYGGLAFIMGWTGGYCLWRCFRHRTCASLASSPFRTIWVRAMTATCHDCWASWQRFCAPSPTWWHRFMVWV